MILDTYTEKHFQAWLDRHVRIDEHDYVRYRSGIPYCSYRRRALRIRMGYCTAC